MGPSEEKGDLEAPESKGGVVCSKCGANLEAGLAECPDCGAPVHGLKVIENLGEPVQAELAKANLLRMRQQFAEAEAICLEILKHFPHNVEAHVLLGDVYSDQGAFDQSAQWYELAQELYSESFKIRQKLQVANDRMAAIENRSTVEQLGLPTHGGSRNLIYACLALVAIIACGFVAYSIGQRHPAASQTPVIHEGVEANAQTISPTGPAVSQKPSVPSSADGRPKPTTAVEEDLALATRIGSTNLSSRLLSAGQDPRTGQIQLTVRMDAAETDRKTAAEAAKDALSAVPEAQSATIRGVRDGKLVYMADVPRQRITDIESPSWQQTASDPDAWVAYVLTNEWFANQAPASSQQPASEGASTP